MTDIQVGATIQPADFPAAVFVQNTTEQTDITTTAPATVGSPTVAVTWTAPTSGRVIIVIGIGGRDTGGGRVLGIPQTFEGTDATGAVVIPNTDDEQHGVVTPDGVAGFCFCSRRSILTGLTPGDPYYTRFVHWADTSGTADIGVRDLTVIPTT